MEAIAERKKTRRPRFRRASEPPAFRLTDGDIEIVRQVARHRFIASGSIAELVDRSLDRTNDRLMRLYHAGYIDRPRAQLDRFPTAGSGRIIYALADRGVRLLQHCDGASFRNLEWSRKNREAHRPFIEHQLEIAEFQVGLERAVREHDDLGLLHPEDILAAAPATTRQQRSPFLLRAKLSHHGRVQEIGVIPDLVFGLRFDDSSRRCFFVEIDRGTMPVVRSDPDQTSFERKMRVYLTAQAAGEHQRQFGWKNFRVLIVTTNQERIRLMIEALHHINIPNAPGPALFFFATADELRKTNPLALAWGCGDRRNIRLV